jgi:hypothetical protein
MQSSFKVFFIFLLVSSCSHLPKQVGRDISSETDKFFITTQYAQKRIQELKAPRLSDGKCFADPETKIYFRNVQISSTGHFRELKQQINLSNLENTQDIEYYFCRITCLLNDRYAAFWTTLSDSPSRHNDDNGFLCQGITMEMTNIPGTSLSSLGPVVHDFSVFNNDDILIRLKELNYQLSSAAKVELDQKTFANFDVVAKSYLTSSLPSMVEAGKILGKISQQSPGSKALLDKYLLMLKNTKGAVKPDLSRDYFILMNIRLHARHLLYQKL